MASFSSLALLSSSVSTAILRCLLATTFSSISFLSNSFSSPHFNVLRVARRCFWWSSVSEELFFSSCSFLVLLLAISFSLLSSAFLSSVSEALENYRRCHTCCMNASLYVTGSGKRYTIAHTMIFLYKRCCFKTRNIFYSLKKINIFLA